MTEAGQAGRLKLKSWIIFGAFCVFVPWGAAQEQRPFPDDEPKNELRVLVAPTVEFPPIAERYGLEGTCDVRFDVLGYGDTIDISAMRCSHPLFCEYAKKGLLSAKFRIVDVPGTKFPGAAYRVVYPFEFKMQSGGEPSTWVKLPCGNGPIS